MAKIYDHSLKLGFNDSLARQVETKMDGLIIQYSNAKVARPVVETGYKQYVANQFKIGQLHGFVKELTTENNAEPFCEEGETRFEHRLRRLSETFKVSVEEVRRNFQQFSVLDALRIGEYWDILNHRVVRKVQPRSLPRAHLISTPTGGMPGYRIRRRR